MRKAILAGATGLVGSDVLQFLLESEVYESVTVLSRRKLLITHPKMHEIILNFDALEDYKDQIQGDDVFCTLGITLKKAGSQEAAHKVEYDYPLQLAKIASQNGATQFLLVSTMGANAKSNNYYFKTKGELENALLQLNYPCLHILRPSLLVGNRNEIRIWEDLARVFMTAFQTFIPKKYRAIQSRTVARFMVSQAEKSEKGSVIYESNQIRWIEIRRFDMKEMREKVIYRDI